MPTKKPRIQTILEENTYAKFKEIAKNERRSESQLAKIMIEQKIQEYEKKHGLINIHIEHNENINF